MSETEQRTVEPLSVQTDEFSVTVEGVRMPVVSTGDRLFVEVPTLGGALRVARHLDSDSLDEPSRLLRATGLTTELRVRGRTVMVVGTDAHSGVVARWLGLEPAELRVGGVASAVGDAVSTTAGHLYSIVR